MLLDPRDRSVHFFSAELTDLELELFLETGAKTVVVELEILPVLMARIVWGERLRGRSRISFVDHDGAKGGLVAG